MSVPTKIYRVLAHLAAGRTCNRFEAEREVHDHALHSTVSRIESYGIPVFRSMETVPGYQGIPTRVARYRIVAKEDRDRARELLKLMAGKKKPAAATAGRNSADFTEQAERHAQGGR